MKRIDYAIALLARLRTERDAPVTRYALLLALARHGKPMSSAELHRAVGEKCNSTGSMRSAETLGLIRSMREVTGKYALTEAGVRLAAGLLNPENPVEA